MEDLELGVFTTRLSKKKIEEIEKFVDVLKKEFDNIRIRYHKAKISKFKQEKPKIISSSTKENANYILITKGSRDILSFYKISKSGGGGGYLFDENLSEKDYSKLKGLLHSHKIAFTLDKNLEQIHKTTYFRVLRYVIIIIVPILGIVMLWMGYQTIMGHLSSWRSETYRTINGLFYICMGLFMSFGFLRIVFPNLFPKKKSHKK